jgi:outer membrane lipoprotein-sorting protein
MWTVLRPDVVGAIALACVAAMPQQQPRAPGIDRLLERIEERYDDVELTAHFVQSRLSRLGSVMSSQEGELYISPPGRMRWEYTTSQQLMVTAGAGSEMYLYFPADNAVQVMQTGGYSPSQYPILYLTGRGRLRRDFDVEVVEWGAPLSRNNVQLELRPRRGEASFERLILEVDPLQGTIVRLVNFDNLRNTIDYQFHDVQYDAGLSDDLFEFEIPDGADVTFIGG